MLLRRTNLPSILLSYHLFLHFSVNFLSHNQAVEFDLKIARKQVLVLILSHNLSHKSPHQPPVIPDNEGVFYSGNLLNRQTFYLRRAGIRRSNRYMCRQARRGCAPHTS